MSDMSLPPLSLVPLASEPGALSPPNPTPPAAGSAAFAWPAPPLAGYPPAAPMTRAEPCEIEGPNGKVNVGRMIGFDEDSGVVSLQIPPARSVLALKPTQYRRLTLLHPLEPQLADASGAAYDATTRLAPGSALERCLLRYKDGGELCAVATARVEAGNGVFLFTLIDAGGRLRRSYHPRVMLADEPLSAERIDEPTAPMPLDPPPAPAPAPAPTAAPENERQRSIGAILLADEISTPEALVEAIEHQARMPMVRIGEALLALRMIDEATLADALEVQRRDRSLPLGELLVRRGDVSRADLQTALARKMGYPIVDVKLFPSEPDAALRLPIAVARRLPALPLMMLAGRLVVALEDPSSRPVIDEIEFTAQSKVLPVLARAGTLGLAIERVYTRLGKNDGNGVFVEGSHDAVLPSDAEMADSTNKLLATLEQAHGSDVREDESQIEQSDNSLVRLINTMILEARQQNVSDIHVECQPGQQKVRVRFRRDGALKTYIELPHTYRAAVVARLKVMCDLDISERRKPQDGKITFGRFVQGQRLELRVATIPTANGLEDVVMRLLSSARAMPLEAMHLQPDTLEKFRFAIERPYGMVLCVGPTGSGKTTTLHAALSHINTPDRKIWTAEDPVEITQAGLRQVQVNPKIDWTFAKALRAFLRADPDVVMVGEIRDTETAQMAIEASLTGHLVLSTLHTNSAPETVTRLLDMGMDPFSFADSLLAVLAQRLVRRLCKHCITREPAADEALQALLDEYLRAYPDGALHAERDALLAEWTDRFGHEGRLMRYRAPGCRHCDHTGFLGRMSLHELMVVSREMRRLVQTNARIDEVQRMAMSEGMRTLRQDGIHKVLAGLTTIEEVRATSNG